MAYKDDATNLVKNTCAICKRYLEEPANRILDDIRRRMRDELNTKQNEFIVDIESVGVLSSADFKKICSEVDVFETEFYFKCSSEYSEADHHIINAFLSEPGDSGSMMRNLDSAIYCLIKANKRLGSKWITKGNWKKVVADFCLERFKENESMICRNSQSIASKPNQELWIPKVIQDWLSMWEPELGRETIRRLP